MNIPIWMQKLETKKSRPEGRLFFRKLITSKQQEQPKRLEQQQRPKQQEQQQQEQQRQQLVLELEQQLEQRLLEQLLELEQQELLLFSSKQPEQQPAWKRSAGIFSWGFP